MNLPRLIKDSTSYLQRALGVYKHSIKIKSTLAKTTLHELLSSNTNGFKNAVCDFFENPIAG